MTRPATDLRSHFRLPRIDRRWLPRTVPLSSSPPSLSTRVTPTSSRTRCVRSPRRRLLDLRAREQRRPSLFARREICFRRAACEEVDASSRPSRPDFAISLTSYLSSFTPQISDGVLDACLAEDPDSKVRLRPRRSRSNPEAKQRDALPDRFSRHPCARKRAARDRRDRFRLEPPDAHLDSTRPRRIPTADVSCGGPREAPSRGRVEASVGPPIGFGVGGHVEGFLGL